MAKKAVAKKKLDQAFKYGVIAVLMSFLVIVTIGAVKAFGPTGLTIERSVDRSNR